jgi:serine/threonine protein kinase
LGIKILHRDISISNILLTPDETYGFLIDLDYAIYIDRVEASGSHHRTGTKPFMAIGVHLGEFHTFMHDLESFFWVFFWICIHLINPGELSIRKISQIEDWDFLDDSKLAREKLGMIAEEKEFNKFIEVNFSSYLQCLIPYAKKLWKVVFPQEKRWISENRGLYSSMIEILTDAMNDPNVQAD